jgi:two-component system KDP operon response regulator KdpE
MTEAMHLVLIIEDDEAIQNILCMLFETNGFRVLVADCASRGEHDARLHRADAVLVDLGLPDGDGIQVIAAIREWSSVPIIVLSARTAEAQRLAAFEQGADDYVIKPFSPGLTEQLVSAERIVDSLRPDKAGQMRVFAVDGSEFTAGEALWMKGQMRSALRACAQGDEASAASTLRGITDLLNAHHHKA